MTRKKLKQKIILPPELPEIPENEIEVSDEDVEFVKQNKDYSSFIVGIDTESINKHVNRVADVDDVQLEAKYEERLKKKALKKEEGVKEAAVERFDALPVKTLDGQLYYRKLSETKKDSKDGEGDDDNEADDGGRDPSVVRLTKADRRAKLKKLKKEAKKQGKDLDKHEEAEQTTQAAVLKNVKCQNLLENGAGGGSVAGSIAKYQPYATDPNLSGALASVLWELNLLSKHYYLAVSTLASSISTMNKAQNQVHLSVASPPQAFTDFSLERESFNLKHNIGRSNKKRKRESGSFKLTSVEDSYSVDEDELTKKLSEHFMLLRDIKENDRLRVELDRTNFSLQLYEEYKKQTKKHDKKQKKNSLYKMLINLTRDEYVFMAKLAEKTQRHEEMVQFMETSSTPSTELTVEERNVLSVAYENAIGLLPAVWRTVSSLEEEVRPRTSSLNCERCLHWWIRTSSLNCEKRILAT